MAEGENHIHDEDFERLAKRIDGLVREVEGISDPEDREKALDLLQLLLNFYGEVLRRVLHIVQSRSPGEQVIGELIVGQMIEDPAVSSALMIHGLHPLELKVRVALALDRLRPHLRSQGVDLRLLGVEEGLAKIRMAVPQGSALSDSVASRSKIMQALNEWVPDLPSFEIQAVPSETASEPSAGDEPETAGSTGWKLAPVPGAADLAMGRMMTAEVEGVELLVCNVGGKLYAFRNVCAHQGKPLDKGLLRGEVLTCPWHGYTYDVTKAGDCLVNPEMHLDPFPLIVEDGVVNVALRMGSKGGQST